MSEYEIRVTDNVNVGDIIYAVPLDREAIEPLTVIKKRLVTKGLGALYLTCKNDKNEEFSFDIYTGHIAKIAKLFLSKENAYKDILDSVEGMLAKYRGEYLWLEKMIHPEIEELFYRKKSLEQAIKIENKEDA